MPCKNILILAIFQLWWLKERANAFNHCICMKEDVHLVLPWKDRLLQSHFHFSNSIILFLLHPRESLSLHQIGQTCSILMQMSRLQPPLVSPISLQLSALNRFPSHWGWISLGPLNGFSRPRWIDFLELDPTFPIPQPSGGDKSRFQYSTRGTDFKSWHCAVTTWYSW